MFFFQLHVDVADWYTVLSGILSSSTGKTYFSLDSFLNILHFLNVPIPQPLLHPHIPMVDDSGLYQIQDVCGPHCSNLADQWVLEKEASGQFLALQRDTLPEGPQRDNASSFHDAIYRQRLVLLDKDQHAIFHFKPCGLSRGKPWTDWFDEIQSRHRPAKRPLDPRLLHLLLPPQLPFTNTTTTINYPFTLSSSSSSSSAAAATALLPSLPSLPPPPPPPPPSSPSLGTEAAEIYDPFHADTEMDEETTTQLSQELSLTQALDVARKDREKARLAYVHASVQAALSKARLEYETARVQTFDKMLSETAAKKEIFYKKLLTVQDIEATWKQALEDCLREMRDTAFKEISQQWTLETKK